MPIALAQTLRHLIKNVPLRWVLTVPFVLPTIGAVVLVGYLSYRNGQDAVEDLGHQLVSATNDRVTQELKAYLQTPLLINRLNVDAVNQAQLDLENIPALESALFNRLQQFEQVSAVLFVNPEGTFRLVEQLSDRYLITADPPRPDRIQVYRLDNQGKRGQWVATEEGLDVRRDRPFYQRAVTTGQPGWNQISQYGSLEFLTLNASQPVYDRATNRLLGVFAVHVRLDYLSQFLAGLEISRSGRIMIMDQSGTLVATSTEEKTYRFRTDKGARSQFEQLKLDESQDGLTRSIGNYLRDHPAILKSLNQSQFLELHHNGKLQYATITPYQDQYGLNWRIVTVIPQSYFMEAIRHNTLQTLLLCLLALGGAITLGLLADDLLIGRFAQLNRASQELAAGNLDQRLPTDYPIYELNSLAQTFNQMADQLQQSFDRITTALEVSEEKFTTIFRNSPDPMSIASLAEGRILEVNDSLIEFFGYSRIEMIGRTALELNFWNNLEDRNRYRALLQQQGSVRNLEVQLCTKWGAVKTALLSTEVRRLEEQDCVIVMFRDISDRKVTELELQQSEARYRAILNALPDLIVRIHRDGTYLDIKLTDAFPLIITHEAIGKNIRDLLPEDVAQKRLTSIQTVLETGEMQVYESPLWVQGQFLWQEIRIVPLNVDEALVVIRDLTQRKQIEEALRRSEANLRQAQRIAHVGSWEIDLETQESTWSEEFFRILGLDPSRSQPSYTEFINWVPVEDRNAVTKAVQEITADGTPYEIEHRIRRSDGTLRYVISKGQAVLNAQQRAVKLYGTLLDITDRKQTEMALQESEARFQEIARTINQVFFVQSITTGQYLYVSPSYEKLWGEPCANLYQNPQSWLKRIHPEDLDHVLQAVNQNFSHHSMSYEYRMIDGEGHVRWMAIEISLVYDEDKQPVRLVGLAEDITDRKRAEAALQESEERFREIAQTLNQVSYVVSLTTGQYLYISPSYERLWGYSCESLYQNPTSWLERIYPEDLEYVLWGFNQVLSGSQVRLEYRIICANGAVHWIKSESLVVYDEDGKPLRMVGLADDITDRKRLEQSLRSQAEEERLLATITQNIRQSLDLNQILATTVIEVQQTLKADRALIFQLNPDGSGQVIQEAVMPDYPMIEQMRWEDEHFSEECHAYYRQGNPRIVPDVATDEWAGCLAEFMQAVGVKSKVVAPIVQVSGESSKVWGLLIVHACCHYRQWQESEADFLQSICNQLAIAIDQANLYQQLQLELAERKQAEAALREREALLRAIGDNLPKGFIYQRVYEPGKGSYYSYVSAGVERLLGLKPEAILANPTITRTIGFEEDLTVADQVAQESLKNLTPIELQMRHRTVTGEVGWSSIRSTPRRLEDGRTIWDGVEVDITDLKRAEAALRTSEEQFRRAFDDAPIGVSLVSMAGRFVKVNARYCDLLGYTEAELLTLTFQEITHPADLDADLEGVQRMLAGETNAFQLEKRYITKQGTIVPVLMNAALIRDQNGQPLYSVGHVQDIRDRLKVERMKDEFISVISHELRTPLTSIRGALGLLSSGVFSDRPERTQRMLQIAINSSERLVRLVNDILTLERLKSNQVQLVLEQCRISDLMQQAVDSVQPIADQAGITLSLSPLSVILWAAPDAIVQALTNLLSNAIKFSPAGSTVWLKAELQGVGEWKSGKAYPLTPSSPHTLTPSPYVLFTVKDQGRGIPEDKLEIIFEHFQQVDISDSRKKGGTGLGLAICKKTVQQHNGKIWVKSKLGEGSTFYFTLPLALKDENE